MKNYHYDKEFFKTFFEGLGISKTELTRILGIKNFTDWPNWLSGQPLRIEHILRLCNYFDLSIECFYHDDVNPKGKDDSENQKEDVTTPCLSGDKLYHQTVDKLRLRLESMAHETAAQLLSKDSEIALLRQQIAQQKQTIEAKEETVKIQRELIEQLKENQNMGFGKPGVYLSEDKHEYHSPNI